MITFEEKSHKYSIDNVPAVGVNELLKSFGIGDCSHIPEHILAPAADFGKKGHLMARYHFENRLDEENLDNKLKPYLVGLKKLCSGHKIEPLAIEKKIGFKALMVCGTPDLVCMFDGVKTILDWKFVRAIRKSSHLSTGGYVYIANTGLEPEEKVKQAKIIHMLPNDYKIIDVEYDAVNEFKALLLAWHIQKAYK